VNAIEPFQDFQATCQRRVEDFMSRELDADFPSQRLAAAIRYATAGGGKRVRPMLAYASGLALGGDFADVDAAACAVEFVHAYSLVHDDLPALDDDDLRRGRPSLHREFDEATAILAGDALQAMAFAVLCRSPASGDARLQMVRELALAVGPSGMVGGQARDMAAVERQVSFAELETTHLLKTGALIQASVTLGALSAEHADLQALGPLRDYARQIGLAFQIHDDVLDETAATETLGKPQGSDRQGNKPTYATLLGLETARNRARELAQQAIAALAEFDEKAAPLRHLATYIIERGN